MDHDDALEQLELAATEPGGLDRLMAGDTPAAAAVAGHLAGCAACAGELERHRRVAPLLRDVILTTPPADLRERTLRFVRERGVDRTGTTPALAARDRRPTLALLAAAAAAVIISVAATTALVGARMDAQLRDATTTIERLGTVAVRTVALTAEPDATRVALTPGSGAGSGTEPSGSILFSPTTRELLIVATGLEPPPPGSEFRCWVEIDGERVGFGRMVFGGALAYWVGDVALTASIPAGSAFGVSLAPVGAPSSDAGPVLSGSL